MPNTQPPLVIDSKYGPIYLELADTGNAVSGKTPVTGKGSGALKVKRNFEEAMGGVEAACKSVMDLVAKVSPEEVQFEAGVKFNAETGFFVIAAGTEFEFKLTLKWTPGQSPTSTTASNPS